MQGRRIQPNEHGYVSGVLAAGEYVRVAPTHGGDGTPLTEEQRTLWYNKPYWLGCAPNGHACNLEQHQVTEHEDGTITVSPSIRITMYKNGQDVELWHGYLERGVWRED